MLWSNHFKRPFACFQYPPTTVCIYRDRVWDDQIYGYVIGWIDIIEGMIEFPISLRKDIITTSFPVPHGLEKQIKQDTSLKYLCLIYRSTEKVQVYPNGTNHLKVEIISFHRTIMEDFLASCLTFKSPSRVPSGHKYHVFKAPMMS